MGCDAWVDRARSRRSQILENCRTGLVGQNARNVVASGERCLHFVCLVDPSAVIQPQVLSTQSSEPDPEIAPPADARGPAGSSAILCPVCGAATVQEKCKVVCKSEICRGRIIMNCAEF